MNPERLVDLARRQLRNKIPQLRLALEGRVTDHHRFLVGQLLAPEEHLEGRIEALSRRIEELSRSFAAAIKAVPRTLNSVVLGLYRQLATGY